MAVTAPGRFVPTTETRRVAPAHHTLLTRLTALAGVVFFALIVVNASLRSGAPSAADPGDDVVRYVSDHAGRLQLGAVLLGFAMSAAMVWLAGLYRMLRRAEGGDAGLAVVALAGGVLAAAGTTLTALVQGTLALRVEDLGASGIRTWWTMSLLSTGLTLLGLLVVVGATAVVAWQRHLFARWFAVASTLLALASLAGAATIGYDSTAIQTVAGLAVLLDSVWILLVSLLLWRDPELAAGSSAS